MIKRSVNSLSLRAVLWIRSGFNANLDPVYYFNTDPDQGRHTNADPELKVTKAFIKIRRPGLFLNFWQISCSCIRIRIPNTDPDPGTLK